MQTLEFFGGAAPGSLVFLTGKCDQTGKAFKTNGIRVWSGGDQHKPGAIRVEATGA